VLRLCLQFAILAVLLFSAIRVWLLTLRARKRNWRQIVNRLRGDDPLLSRITYSPLISADIACPPADLLELVGGRYGLLLMLLNVATLLEAIDYLAEETESAGQVIRAIPQLRAYASEARSATLLCLCKMSLFSPEADQSALAIAARGYLTLIANIGLTLRDFRPELLVTMRGRIV
jgi:hypothetical protein